jgi:hypothetical protein
MISDDVIREYLLGQLDAGSAQVEQIDEQALMDQEFSTRVDIVEDEIIEEYIEGALTPVDREAVEGYFLRPPERQRKLRNARLLSCHLAATSLGKEGSVPPPESSNSIFHRWALAWKMPGLRVYAEIAAGVLFAVSVAYLVYQRRELSSAVERSNQQLAAERQQLAILQRQSPSPIRIIEPPEGVLTLLEAGRTRSTGHLPAVKVGNASGTLHVEVAVTADTLHQSSGKYQVRLQHAGLTLWSLDGVEALAVPGGAILKLDLPAEILPIGSCELVIKQSGNTDLSYPFVVSGLR